MLNIRNNIKLQSICLPVKLGQSNNNRSDKTPHQNNSGSKGFATSLTLKELGVAAALWLLSSCRKMLSILEDKRKTTQTTEKSNLTWPVKRPESSVRNGLRIAKKSLRNTKKFILSIVFIMSSFFSVFSQETLNLNAILKLVEQNNQELKAFDSQQESQQVKATGSNSWMAPMVGAGTFMTPYPGQNTMDKGSLMFTLEQSLPNKGMNKAKEKYLSSLSAITAAQKSMTFNYLRTLAKQNYYTVIVNQKRLKYFEESLIIMNNMKKLGEIRYQYNKGNLSQIYKAEGRIYEMQNMIEEIRNDITVAKMNLNILMNRNPDTDFSISSETSVYFKPVAIVDSTYLANNISELKMAESEISSMRLDADMIRKEVNPEIKLKFDHMSPLSTMMPQQYSAMAMLSIPLAPWSAKSYKANLKANKLEIEAMEHRKSSMINNMYGMVKTMERSIITMEKRVKNFEDKIIPAMQKNLDVLMLNYQENKEELPMVIDGWETLNKSRLDYTNELENYYKMIVDYEKSIEK